MIWKNIPLAPVLTADIIYFDKEHKDECRRIGEKIQIDCFPDAEKSLYWKWDKKKWNSYEVRTTLEREFISHAFYDLLLHHMEENDSRIAFTTNSGIVDGMIHFQNYECPEIYGILNENILLFEQTFRSYLVKLGFNFNHLEEFFKHRISLETEESKRERLEKQLEYLKLAHSSQRTRESKVFDSLYMSGLLAFATSEHHSLRQLSKIGFKGENFDKELLRELKNRVSRFPSYSKMDEDQETGFSSFKVFFHAVRHFESIFYFLASKIFEFELEDRKILNRARIKSLGSLSDEELNKLSIDN